MSFVKGILRNLLTSLVLACAYLMAIIICSYILYPRLSKDICITDPKMNEHTEAIDEVIKAFNASGIVMKRSCDDYTSINMSMSEVGFEDDTLAVTNAYGFPLTFYNLDSLGQEQESYQIFVPMIFVWQRIIRFNLTEKSPTLANKRVFQLTLVHEIGHALGAPHTADTANIMYPYVSASTNQSLKSATRQVKDSTNYLQRYRTTK